MNEYRYSDITVGMKESFTVTVTEDMMSSFLSITEDYNVLHQNEEYAKTKGYSSRVVYGMLTASFLSTLAGIYLPGKYSIIHDVSFKLPKPVYIGDRLTVEGEVEEKHDTFKVIELKVTVLNQENIKVLRGSMRIGLLE